jgi:hypothetical protein
MGANAWGASDNDDLERARAGQRLVAAARLMSMPRSADDGDARGVRASNNVYVL